MWHIILNHFLGSEAESGVRVLIRPNPGSINSKMFENGQHVRKFKIFKTGSVDHVRKFKIFKTGSLDHVLMSTRGAENDSGVLLSTQRNLT